MARRVAVEHAEVPEPDRADLELGFARSLLPLQRFDLILVWQARGVGVHSQLHVGRVQRRDPRRSQHQSPPAEREVDGAKLRERIGFGPGSALDNDVRHLEVRPRKDVQQQVTANLHL